MRRTARLLAAALAAATLMTGTACGSGSDRPSPGGPNPTPDTFPVTVGSLTLDRRPERVVSLAPAATEMLFAVDAGRQVVAVDELSNYPASAPRTSLSGFTPNAEAISAYNPDLVVLSNDMDKIVSQLQALRIPTYLASAATSLEDTYRELTDIGRLTGHTGTARAVVDRMREDIRKLTTGLPTRTRPLTYYYELDDNYYSLTSKTFVGSLFGSVGLVNIADTLSNDANPYPQLSAEVIVAANPDLIFLADTKCCGQSRQTVAKRAGWSGVAAVRTGQVIELDDDVASRWGPRVVDLVRAITGAVAAVPVG